MIACTSHEKPVTEFQKQNLRPTLHCKISPGKAPRSHKDGNVGLGSFLTATKNTLANLHIYLTLYDQQLRGKFFLYTRQIIPWSNTNLLSGIAFKSVLSRQ